MTTETDPRLVREIAETAFRSDVPGGGADRVEAALIASGVAGPVLGEKFDAYSTSVGAEYERLEAAAGSTTTSGGHYSRILAFAQNLPAEGDAIAGFNRGGKRYELTRADLLAFLDDYSAAVQSMVKIEDIITAFDERDA